MLHQSGPEPEEDATRTNLPPAPLSNGAEINDAAQAEEPPLAEDDHTPTRSVVEVQTGNGSWFTDIFGSLIIGFGSSGLFSLLVIVPIFGKNAAIVIWLVLGLFIALVIVNGTRGVRIFRLIGRTVLGIRLRKAMSAFLSWSTRNKGWGAFILVTTLLIQLVLTLAFHTEGKSLAAKLGWHFDWLTTNQVLLGLFLFVPVAQQIIAKIRDWVGGDDQAQEIKQLSYLHENRREFAHEILAVHEDAINRGLPKLKEVGEEVWQRVAYRLMLAFQTISPSSASVTVQIFPVQNGMPSASVARSPAHFVAHTALKTLQKKNSFVRRTIASRELDVIADIQKEVSLGDASRFVVCSEHPGGAKGSLICFPVQRRSNGEVLAVVSIHSSTANAFVPANKSFYKRELQLYEADLVFGAIFEKAHEALHAKTPRQASTRNRSRGGKGQTRSRRSTKKNP